MNYLSLLHHSLIIVSGLICLIVASALLPGCYSFTGASVPSHLKTLSIPTVEDRSGFGDGPRYRQVLTDLLITGFRNDNSFELEQSDADALLRVSIGSIRDETANVDAGELENERKVTVTVQARYEDQVKKFQVWDKSFPQFELYNADEGIVARDAAIELALEQISEDILLAVVSGW